MVWWLPAATIFQPLSPLASITCSISPDMEHIPKHRQTLKLLCAHKICVGFHIGRCGTSESMLSGVIGILLETVSNRTAKKLLFRTGTVGLRWIVYKNILIVFIVNFSFRRIDSIIVAPLPGCAIISAFSRQNFVTGISIVSASIKFNYRVGCGRGIVVMKITAQVFDCSTIG